MFMYLFTCLGAIPKSQNKYLIQNQTADFNSVGIMVKYFFEIS